MFCDVLLLRTFARENNNRSKSIGVSAAAQGRDEKNSKRYLRYGDRYEAAGVDLLVAYRLLRRLKSRRGIPDLSLELRRDAYQHVNHSRRLS